MQIVLENEEACDSHYLPKSVYRAALAKELKNPNAVVIANGQCKQVSDQLRGPVFCAYSEQKLNKNGETWVMARTPHRHEEIFLQKALLAIERSAFQDRLDIYQVRGKEGLDFQKRYSPRDTAIFLQSDCCPAICPKAKSGFRSRVYFRTADHPVRHSSGFPEARLWPRDERPTDFAFHIDEAY